MADNCKLVEQLIGEFIRPLSRDYTKCKLEGELVNIENSFDYVAAEYIYDNDVKDHETLLAIAKAGTYIRYAADDIRDILDSEDADNMYESALEEKLIEIVVSAIDRKIEEDTVHEEDMKEVEKLMAETEEIVSEMEEASSEVSADIVEGE